MTLQQLRYVIAVSESKSISEAAEKVFISQPSLTQAVHLLEDEMHVQIFSRTNKGIETTKEGEVFLGYARQVVEQADLLEETYAGKKSQSPFFCVSCQHYSFAVNAMVDVIKKFGGEKYNYTLRETQTFEIIDDVARLKSEIGILYLSRQNEEIITKLLKKNDLIFKELFTAAPHVFISDKNPLCAKSSVKVSDLKPFPYLVFEQGEHNSFYFSEEPFSFLEQDKIICVRDRATLFNLLIGLDGFTVSSGVISEELNGKHIVARPLEFNEEMRIGIITKKNIALSRYAESYIKAIRRHI